MAEVILTFAVSKQHMRIIPKPSNDWINAPQAHDYEVVTWNNLTGRDNFMSKTQLRERSRQRGLKRMHEVKRGMK